MGDKFRVHEAPHETTVSVPAKVVIDGKSVDVEGRLSAMIVELVPVAPHLSSYRHVAVTDTPERLAQARTLFQKGAIVEMGEFTAVKETA